MIVLSEAPDTDLKRHHLFPAANTSVREFHGITEVLQKLPEKKNCSPAENRRAVNNFGDSPQ
jgi:hypothetical protein